MLMLRENERFVNFHEAYAFIIISIEARMLAYIWFWGLHANDKG